MIPLVDLKPQYLDLKEKIDRRIQNVLNHGQFILGPEVEECEKALAEFVGTKHAVTCSNGTVSLQVAMMALGIGPGDEVITTCFSFIATAEVIVLVGATPVYVDIDPTTYNLDPHKLSGAITSKTKAIVPVSLYGQTAEMDAINAVASQHGIPVLEDAAQSFGALYSEKRSCNLSLVGSTSFFPAKPLGCYGDGGALFTNDDSLAEAFKEIRGHGSKVRYHHTRIGLNARMNTIQCAILIEKLKRYPWEMKARDAIAKKYNAAFAAFEKEGLRIPKVEENRTSVWAQYTLSVSNRDQFQAFLKERGCPTSVHYPLTMPQQPAYKNIGRDLGSEIGARAAREVVSLPLYADMSDAQVNSVIQIVSDYF